jgi:hypothetical protein
MNPGRSRRAGMPSKSKPCGRLLRRNVMAARRVPGNQRRRDSIDTARLDQARRGPQNGTKALTSELLACALPMQRKGASL